MGSGTPRHWAMLLSLLQEENADCEFEDDYIWFGAEPPDAAEALPATGGKPLVLSSSSGPAQQQRIASIGTHGERQRNKLAVELAQRWAESSIGRLEQQLDDALDALELVSAQLLQAVENVAIRDRTIDSLQAEAAATRADRDACRCDAESLSRDIEQLTAELLTSRTAAPGKQDTLETVAHHSAECAAVRCDRDPAREEIMSSVPLNLLYKDNMPTLNRDPPAITRFTDKVTPRCNDSLNSESFESQTARWRSATRFGWPPKTHPTPHPVAIAPSLS